MGLVVYMLEPEAFGSVSRVRAFGLGLGARVRRSRRSWRRSGRRSRRSERRKSGRRIE